MLSRAMTRAYDEAFRPLGIKFSQMNILMYVTLNGPIQPSEVADGLSLEKSTLSRNVKILESNGWLKTLPGDSAKTQTLQITREGAALVTQVMPRWRGVQDELVALIGTRTASDMIKAASRLRDRGQQ